MGFDDLKDSLHQGMRAQSNYQFVVICHLTKCDTLSDTKQNIAKVLAENNPTKNKPYNYFMSVPVWGVLEKKKIIRKLVNGDYKLCSQLDQSQRKEISSICGDNFAQ